MMNAILSLLMLAGLALLAGAIYLLRRGDTKKQPILMLVLAAILFANAAIWVLPNESGVSLLHSGEPAAR